MPFVGLSQNNKGDEIVDFPKKMAEFPGGEDALYQFIADNIEYPKEAREKGIQGKLFVEFIIWSDGSVGQIKVLNKIGGGCEEEVIRVIKLMPNWTPAEQGGKIVNSKFILPIIFNLSDEDKEENKNRKERRK